MEPSRTAISSVSVYLRIALRVRQASRLQRGDGGVQFLYLRVDFVDLPLRLLDALRRYPRPRRRLRAPPASRGSPQGAPRHLRWTAQAPRGAACARRAAFPARRAPSAPRQAAASGYRQALPSAAATLPAKSAESALFAPSGALRFSAAIVLGERGDLCLALVVGRCPGSSAAIARRRVWFCVDRVDLPLRFGDASVRVLAGSPFQRRRIAVFTKPRLCQFQGLRLFGAQRRLASLRVPPPVGRPALSKLPGAFTSGRLPRRLPRRQKAARSCHRPRPLSGRERR